MGMIEDAVAAHDLEASPAAADAADLAPAGAVRERSPRTPLLRAAFLIGSAGLLAATCTDALAVLGRHAGFPLLGSIEIVQVTVVLIASSAMIAATLERAHAAVHIVTGKLPPTAADASRRVAALLGAALFVAIAAGSAWVASDLWGGVERTELLGLPLRWFRLLWIAAALLVAVLFVRQALARGAR